VTGLRSEAIQRKLLAETNVTFKSACNTALSMEMASRNTLELSGKIKESATVNKVYINVKREMTRENQGTQTTATGKRAAWMTSSNSYVSPATDVVVSIRLLCADLNKKNVTMCRSKKTLHKTHYVEQEAGTSPVR